MGKEWDQPGRHGSQRRNGQSAVHMGEAGRVLAQVGDTGAMDAGRYDLSPHAMRSFQAWVEAWAVECLRVLKPGGHMLAFGGSRTWHRLASGAEDAGFEIRDSIAWLYGTGFPKSLDAGKATKSDRWEGWGTALKPSFEPIVLGRKPLAGTVAVNLRQHGTGALNIDACRVPTSDDLSGGAYAPSGSRSVSSSLSPTGMNRPGATAEGEFVQPAGRWPTNVVLDDRAAGDLDDQSGVLTSGTMRAGGERQPRTGGEIYGADARIFTPADTYGDRGGASRFFPVFHWRAKAASGERPKVDGQQHPTVKPLDLMRWCV